jgi:hypothetical protein
MMTFRGCSYHRLLKDVVNKAKAILHNEGSVKTYVSSESI